jgi:hypothetical protein
VGYAFDIGRLRPYGTGQEQLVAGPDIGRRNEIRQVPLWDIRPNRQTVSLQKTGSDQVRGEGFAASEGVRLGVDSRLGREVRGFSKKGARIDG